MRSILRKTYLALGLFTLVSFAPTPIPTTVHAQPEIPAYAKWGRIALKETGEKYPRAQIIDYLHQGSEVKRDSTIEKFKLWLKEGNREFGVFVTIEFMTETEKVVRVEFEETSR